MIPPMSDEEARSWAEDLAAEPPPAAPSPTMPDAPPAPRKQGPKKRLSRPRNLTLTPEASAKLDALAEQPGSPGRSAIASAAILAYEPPRR